MVFPNVRPYPADLHWQFLLLTTIYHFMKENCRLLALKMLSSLQRILNGPFWKAQHQKAICFIQEISKISFHLSATIRMAGVDFLSLCRAFIDAKNHKCIHEAQNSLCEGVLDGKVMIQRSVLANFTALPWDLWLVICDHLCTQDLCRIQGMIELQLLLFQRPVMMDRYNFI